MTLHPEWRALLARAWSVRFMLAAAVFDAIAFGADFLTDTPNPRLRMGAALLGMAATVLAPVARLMPQGNLGGEA